MVLRQTLPHCIELVNSSPLLCDWPEEEDTERTEGQQRTLITPLWLSGSSSILFQELRERVREKEANGEESRGCHKQTDSCRLNMKHHPVALPQSLLFFPSLLVVHNALSHSLQLFITPQLSTVNNNVSSWRERGRGASLRQCILMV